MLTRRQFLRLGAVVGGAALVPVSYRGYKTILLTQALAVEIDPGDLVSPATRPFRDRLPIPRPPAQRSFTPDPLACPDPANRVGARFYQLVQEEAAVRVHSDFPQRTLVWRYRDASVAATSPIAAGPTFVVGAGLDRRTVFVRVLNRLPPDHEGFGVPRSTVHLHGAHVEARSDGFPENTDALPAPVVFVPPGFAGFDAASAPTQYDYCYEHRDTGFAELGGGDETERPATLWYHDHLFDFTGPNVYRGLAGFHLVFDEVDAGDETGTRHPATNLRLPSGVGKFDIPLVFQDRLYDQNAQLVYLPGNHDGFLGDKFLVNGVIQPFLPVKRRKYRFRLLNGANARFFQIFLTDVRGNTYGFDHIGSEGGLFAKTLRDRQSVLIANAQRAEIVIDFSRFPNGAVLYLENRLRQEDGRGPAGTFEVPELVDPGARLLQFRVSGTVTDQSRVPDELRPFAPASAAQLAAAPRRTFMFERRHGAWVVNGELADLERPVVKPTLDVGEIWTLKNGAGGWWHPVHIHHGFMRVLKRNGRTPPQDEQDGFGKRDTVTLGPNGEVEAFLHFQDYPGPFVFHCHNIEHEDMRMMARFDPVRP